MSEAEKPLFGTVLIVCGGRAYGDRKGLFDALDNHPPIAMIVHGGATGADALAADWARSRGKPSLLVPADWESLGASAGPIRNKQMLEIAKAISTLAYGLKLIAFPGGVGTASMLDIARKHGGINVVECYP